jgi:hypothetical protein
VSVSIIDIIAYRKIRESMKFYENIEENDLLEKTGARVSRKAMYQESRTKMQL